jgi:hypothetical protein
MKSNPKKRILIHESDSDEESAGKAVVLERPVIPVIKNNLYGLNIPSKNQNLPIIAQNAIPGMSKLKNDNDKYKLDVSMRIAEDSDYSRVPIEQFGEAMLRG